MTTRCTIAVVVAGLLVLPAAAGAQARAPNLSKEQRESLRAAVMAARTAIPLSGDQVWQMHLLRASDGSHYVAFSAQAPGDLTPADPLALYVRLEPRPEPGATATAQPRSAVEEWLAGQRSDPLPQRAGRVVQIPTGEMPVGGNGATLSRDGAGQNSAVLALIERQQQKAQEEREAKERARREMLEGKAGDASDLMPFEDFDLAGRVVDGGGGTAVFRRAITAGPGTYDVVVGWTVMDRRNRPVRSGAFRRAVALPTVPAGQFALGSIIVADSIGERTAMFGADQQTAHPYTIGPTEIVPAADQTFTNDERLALAFQIFNPMPSPSGKPDVGVAFRLFRQTPTGEEPGPGLAPLQYTEETLPADFNLALGHPLLAAFTAPLRTLPRGEYRLAVGATDRNARTSATSEIRFRVIATATTLLAGAPAFTTPFSRARWQDAAVLDPALDALAPSASTPALTRLLNLARQRRFVDLVPDTEVAPAERGVAVLLQAVAAFALGDTPRAVAVRVERSLELGAPPGAARFWLGAAQALENRDADAIDAWRASRSAGWPVALVATPIAEAQVRLRQPQPAGETAREGLAAGIVDAALVRVAAAADLAAGRATEAATRLRLHLATTPDDVDAQWMLLHALFSQLAGGGPLPAATAREEFLALAGRYIDAGGRNRTLADEWRGFVTSSGSAGA